LPWVVSLIVAGIAIGPHGFSLTEVTPTLDFFATIGLVFLMFMAGLEVRLSSLKESKKGVMIVSFLNGAIPFLLGWQIGLFLGYSMTASLLLGAVFISSSIAIVVPSLTRNNLLKTKLGKTTIGATMIEDILSLILLSVILQTNVSITFIPLPLFYILLAISLLVFRWLAGKMQTAFFKKVLAIFKKNHKKDIFQDKLRFVITLLLGIVIIFEILGLHPIIAGFFAGLIMSDIADNEKVKEKLRIVSYGFFIPIFFVVIGMQTDISLLLKFNGALVIVSAIVLSSMASKFISGIIGGTLSGFNFKESALIGSATMPQLTTTLAVAFAGLEFGLFDQKLVTALVALSLISVVISPLLINMISKKVLQNIS